MTIKKVPAYDEVTCDCCNKVCEPQNLRKSAKLILYQSGLDYSGCPVGDATIRWDLCDRCASIIGVAIVNEIESVQNVPSEKGE